MHLEDELFDVLELSERLWVSGGSTSEHQGGMNRAGS